MTKLSPIDARHLLAAEGWLELGNHLEANEELEKITPLFRAHPDVMDLRWQIYAKAKQWTACVDLGKALIASAPDSATSWTYCAIALHEMKRTGEAFEVLTSALDTFPTDTGVLYRLARYATCLGKLDEARDFLDRAFSLGNSKELKLRALDEPDLKPLFRE